MDTATTSLSGAVEALVALGRTNPELGSALRAFAEAMLAEFAPSPAASPCEAAVVEIAAGAAPQPAQEPASPAAAAARQGDRPVTRAELAALVKRFTDGAPAATAPDPAATPPPAADGGEGFDLALVEQRCRLKAEGARWAAERRRLFREGADYRVEIEPRDGELIARARELRGCFLWLNGPGAPEPESPEQFGLIANCFENLADALFLVRATDADEEAPPGDLELAVDLLAEAQSAVRGAASVLDRVDSDQDAAFGWLRATTRERSIRVDRFMRVNDPADPAAWQELASRIEEALGRGERRRRAERLFAQVRQRASRLTSGGGTGAAWESLGETVGALLAAGTPPSNVALRQALLPLAEADHGEGEIPEPLRRVFSEIDRFMAARPAAAAPTTSREPTAEVQKVAGFLRGRSVVLIGGDRRRDAEQALRDAFGLQELYWIETREHGPLAMMEHYVARPDVVLVLLAVRWSSHSYGDVQAFCNTHEKVLVRLPAGYNPNRVADEVLRQASDRLHAGGA